MAWGRNETGLGPQGSHGSNSSFLLKRKDIAGSVSGPNPEYIYVIEKEWDSCWICPYRPPYC